MPLEPHPTDPNLVVYRVQKYAIPRWEWQGLTEQEIIEALQKANLPTQFSYRMAGKAIEAKLKEKNT